MTKRVRSRKGKTLLAALLVLIALLFIVRAVGMAANSRTPPGGINEDLYVDINGSRQWISIYGEDRDNPLLLYLHGGPGSATSMYDYAFTRKWADVYTVVSWDQRNCGKSLNSSPVSELSCAQLVDDGLALTEFLRDYMETDKITLLGHSWGSYLGWITPEEAQGILWELAQRAAEDLGSWREFAQSYLFGGLMWKLLCNSPTEGYLGYLADAATCLLMGKGDGSGGQWRDFPWPARKKTGFAP